ncbi:MAG TPA: hypothetical protein VH593_09975 [Ktedonobacteraceae bacterium]
MNALNLQAHEIVIHQNRKRLAGITSIAMLASFYLIGRDVFTVWAFGSRNTTDLGEYLDTLPLLLGTIVWGWLLFVILPFRLRLRGPIITINSQGFSFPASVRFTLLPRFRQSFLPWEEIEWIASSRTGMFTSLSLSLKDPAHYWSRYGNGPFRTWRRDVNGAHININQYFLSVSASHILQHIEAHYRSELLTYGVQIRY